MKNCSKCNVPIYNKFCANCGQAAELKHIDKHYISHEIQHLLHFEKGIFFTIKELFLRPGETVKTFLREDRTKHMKPIAFLAITTLLFGLISKLVITKPGPPPENWPFSNPMVQSIDNWLGAHSNYNYLIISFFAAIWLKLFFNKYKYGFYEIITFMCFLAGQLFIFFIFLIPFHSLLNNYVFLGLIFIVAWVYPAFAIGQFFNKDKFSAYLKGLFAMILGYASVLVVKIGVGLAVYHIIALFK